GGRADLWWRRQGRAGDRQRQQGRHLQADGLVGRVLARRARRAAGLHRQGGGAEERRGGGQDGASRERAVRDGVAGLAAQARGQDGHAAGRFGDVPPVV